MSDDKNLFDEMEKEMRGFGKAIGDATHSFSDYAKEKELGNKINDAVTDIEKGVTKLGKDIVGYFKK